MRQGLRDIPLTDWLRRLGKSLPVARLGRDPEGVHQVRVASGRIATWLELGDWHVLRDDVRWLRGGAGAVRDLDVLLQRKPPEPFAMALRRVRTSRRRALRQVLDSPRLPALLAALAVLPPLPRSRARERVHALRELVLERGRELERRGVEHAGACHDLRRLSSI